MNRSWLFFAFAALFCFGLSDNIRGPIFPELLKHFGINHFQGAWFFSTVSLVSVLSALAMPRVIEKWGHVVSLRAVLLTMGASQLIYALAPSYEWILFGAVLFGLSAGGLGVVQNVMVLLAAPSHYHSRAQSALHACYGAASLLAPLIVFAVAHLGGTWEKGFFVTSAVLFMLAVVVREAPSQKKGQAHNPILKAAPAEASRVRGWKIEEVYFAMILSCYVIVEVMVGTRLAVYLREVRQMDLENSSLMVTVFFVGLLAGRLLLVFWQPPVSLRGQLLASMGGSLLCLALALAWEPLVLVASGMFMAPFFPLMMVGVGRLFPARMEANMALCNAFQGAGLVSMHSVVGWVTDRFGIEAALKLGTFMSAFVILLLLCYPRFFRRSFG